MSSGESITDVLRAARGVDWTRLRHLRGTAADVPQLLEGLVAHEEETRRHALRSLGTRILPFYDGLDGAVCEVTSHVVPYLVRLARAGAPHASELLVLLRRIASVAWDRDPFPVATRSAALTRRLLVRPASPIVHTARVAHLLGIGRDAAAALYRHFDPLTAELLYGRRVHEVLAEQVPEIFALLADEREDVRVEAARLIERLAQSAARPPGLARKIIVELESQREEVVVAQLVLALGRTEEDDARTLLEALQDTPDAIIRTLAALSYPGRGEPSSSKRIAILVDALSAPERCERYDLATGRALPDDVSRALLANPLDRGEVLSQLLSLLASARDRELPEALYDVLLEVTFPDASAPVRAATLTREQRLVLRNLTSLERKRPRDLDLSAKLATKGLPTDPRALEKLVMVN